MDVFDLPENHPIRLAHKRSIYHRSEVENSTSCGCFYCLATYPPDHIADWTDGDKPHAEQTALCPKCGIDSVIGDCSGFELSPAFLRDMRNHWFGPDED